MIIPLNSVTGNGKSKSFQNDINTLSMILTAYSISVQMFRHVRTEAYAPCPRTSPEMKMDMNIKLNYVCYILSKIRNLLKSIY